MSTRAFLFVLGSARQDGNTEQLARLAAAHLPAGVAQRWVRLGELPLEPFLDIRHSGDGRYPAATGNEQVLLEATLAATDIVIASPLYWYSLSADTKLYLDYWSGWLRVPGADFKARMRGKMMWAISTYSGGDPAEADPLLGTLRLTARYLGMPYAGELLAAGNFPGDVHKDHEALARAKTFFDLAAPASIAESVL
ncbi:MAG TPA: flavodoxin family protein [Polyangia bacterium]